MSKKEEKRSYLKTYKKLMGKHMKLAKIMFVSMFFMSLTSVATTIFLSKYGIDKAFRSDSYKMIIMVAVVNLVLVLLNEFFYHLAWRLAMTNRYRICLDLRKKIFHKMINFDMEYYSSNPSGAMLHNVLNDVEEFSEGGMWNLMNIISSISTMAISLVILTIFNFKLSLIIYACLPIVFVLTSVLLKLVSRYYKKIRDANRARLGQINEGIIGYATLKTLNIDEKNVAEFSKTNHHYTSLRIKRMMTNILVWRGIDTIILIGLVFLYPLSYKAYTANEITIGGLYLFFSLFNSCVWAMADLSSEFDYFGQVSVAAFKIEDTLSYVPLVKDREKTIEGKEHLKGNIRLEKVTFKYPKGETVLKDFDLSIKEKEKIAIVGRTGSGKSTLASLIYRFYEPSEGKIYLDDVDYLDYKIDYIHQKIGFILQDSLLFNDTIFNNICYGKLDATLEEVRKVASLVGIDDYIMSLDKQYDSLIGESGASLSLGQKQQISFARVLLKNPDIVILDEATANIDTETERLIQKGIEEYFKDKTCIFIAHRLSTIRNVDRILYLDKGEIIEEGNHDSLMAKKGKYYNLYQNQFLNKQLTELGIVQDN